ncbi:MAG: NTP/NDP exchange transporter [Pseudomonadales bacterium]
MKLTKLVDVLPAERVTLAWAFVYFYCLLCSYYIIRPIRDAMGISSGVDNLQYLYFATIVIMLALVPLFGWITSRWPRRKFLPFIYLFFILNLVVFYFLFRFYPNAALLSQSFYLWVNVFNLFVVSVFWSFMSDIFTDSQAKRLFGFIAAGGSAGAITGPIITSLLIETVGLQNLLLVSAAFLVLAIACISRIVDADRTMDAATKVHAVNEETDENKKEKEELAEVVAPNKELLKGGAWDGIFLVYRSPYLLGICVLMLCYSVLSTFLYFQQVQIIGDNFTDANARTVMFARVDLVVNVLTIVCQLFITSRLIKTIGLGLTLAIVPALLVLGLALLGLAPVFGWSMLVVVIALQVVRRVGYYAIINPARENLFVVVSRAEKYKAKNFIDTSVYRGGDMLAAGLSGVLRSAGFTIASIAFMAVPLALLWAAVSLWLGKKHDERTAT